MLLKTQLVLFVFCLVALQICFVVAHSWVACTDYKLNTLDDEKVYDGTKCMGYARNFKNGHTNDPFGANTGFNYQPGADGAPCRDALRSPYLLAYDTARPMATYTPGQNVCLAWSPQNHVAATCINQYIPDSGTKVYISGPNPTADIPVKQMTLVKDFGANPKADAYVGYQHCPLFCSNPVGALCTGCFIVPNNLQPGDVHTFIWNWAFNAPTDIYSTCWEAQIAGAASTTATSSPTYPKGCTSDADCQANQLCDISATCVTKTTAPPTTTPPTTTPPTTTPPTNNPPTNNPPTATPVGGNPNSLTTNLCKYHADCASGVCGVDGACVPKDNVTPAISVLFALLFVIVLVALVLAIKFPERMPCYSGAAL